MTCRKTLLIIVTCVATALFAALLIHTQSEGRQLRVQLDALRSTGAEASGLREEIVRLKSQIEDFKNDLRDLRLVFPSTANRVGDATVRIPATPNLQSDQTTEKSIHELKEVIAEIRNGLVKRGTLPPGSNEVISAQAVILNEQADVAEKLAALRTLRAANARSDEVVRQMVRAYYSTEDPRFQADIFRQLEGVTTPELKTLLLEAVSQAVDAEVREEAAETLSSYLPDPNVRTWLEHLAKNDPSEGVRRQATDSLKNVGRR